MRLGAICSTAKTNSCATSSSGSRQGSDRNRRRILVAFDGRARAVHRALAAAEPGRRLDQRYASASPPANASAAIQLGGIALHSRPGSLRSRTVTDLVAGSGLIFIDYGERDLDGLPGTWQLFAVKPP